jgi:anti-anti-sigma factor
MLVEKSLHFIFLTAIIREEMEEAKKVKILVVDEECETREILSSALREEGYEVMSVEDGCEAIEKLRKCSFNVLIIDAKMLDVLEIAKESNSELQIIMITESSLPSAFEALEVFAYVLKPLDIDGLKAMVRRAVERQILILENKNLLKKLEETRYAIVQEKDKLESILKASEEMNSILNLKKLTDCIVRRVAEILQANRVSLMLINKSGDLVVKAALGLREEIVKSIKVKVGAGFCGRVAKEGTPLLVENVEKDFQRRSSSPYKTRSFLIAPLKVKGKVIGVINVADKKNGTFNEDDLKFLSIVSQHGAIAIENVRLYEKTRKFAITDDLTKLFNRRYGLIRLEEEFNRAERYGRPLSLIMMDIDCFKNYNDTQGHIKGDIVLRRIAHLMKENTRRVDIITRYGGEEFLIILPETGLEGAKVIAEKIRKMVEEYPFEEEHRQPGGQLTISGGVATYQKNIKNMEEMIDRADLALYRAKQIGKNKICCFDTEEDEGLSLTKRVKEGICLITLEGKLNFRNINTFRRELSSLAERGEVNILLDMENLSEVDTSAIGEIVFSLNRVRELGGEVKVLGIQPKVREVFESTHLAEVIEIFKDERKAFESFK